MLEQCHGVKQQHEQMIEKLNAIDHQLYRYEDVVFDKRSWIQSMVTYLSLEAAPAMLDRIVERNDVIPQTEQNDSHIRRVSPGDHKEKLAPETIERLNSEFAPILNRYGYVD